MTPEQQKFYFIKTYKDYDTIGDDVDYKVIEDHDRKEVVLMFEESDSRQDWVNNFLFLPWPLKLENKKIVWTTLGYARAYKSTQRKPVIELLKAYINNPGYKLVIRGWSFGSAMAKIAVRHLETATYTADELTTYGDVKCWLNPFYKTKAKRVREYTTPNDLVTWCVPFFYRDHKCKVGPRFKLTEAIHSEKYHTRYEEYDYSKWEEA